MGQAVGLSVSSPFCRQVWGQARPRTEVAQLGRLQCVNGLRHEEGRLLPVILRTAPQPRQPARGLLLSRVSPPTHGCPGVLTGAPYPVSGRAQPGEALLSLVPQAEDTPPPHPPTPLPRGGSLLLREALQSHPHHSSKGKGFSETTRDLERDTRAKSDARARGPRCSSCQLSPRKLQSWGCTQRGGGWVSTTRTSD